MQMSADQAIPSEPPNPWQLWLGIIGFIIALDQISKAIARSALAEGNSVGLIGEFLSLTLTFNSGASFGILEGALPLILLFSVFAAAVIFYFLIVDPPKPLLMRGAMAVAAGGVFGNLVDRLRVGEVTDFIHFSFWPVFNVADIAITVGVAVIVTFLLIDARKQTSAAARD